MAMLTSIVANYLRDRDKKPEPFTAGEFVSMGESLHVAQVVDRSGSVVERRSSPVAKGNESITDVQQWEKIKSMARVMAGNPANPITPAN